MKLNKTMFVLLMIISILLIVYGFKSMEVARNTAVPTVGGEFFLLALPLLLIKWRVWTAEQEEEQNERNEQ
jgi:membrane protein CcdC involved in cytochrome C biogenesis